MTFSSILNSLPVYQSKTDIVDSLRNNRSLIVTAPPGSGKSTCIPLFFLDDNSGIDKTIIVLQPRRIAARQLANFCAQNINEKLGDRVGYQVRFENKTSANTRLIFMTYGVFVRQMAQNQQLNGVGLVILDEFHERSLDMDLSLLWLRQINATSTNVPKFMVMSATLNGTSLSNYCNTKVIEITARTFPVSLSHQIPKPFEAIEDQAVRALRSIIAQNDETSTLIFMPGTGEIKRTAERAFEICKPRAIAVHELHGRLSLEDQHAIVNAPTTGPCVIITTNVAETSLTIPGVTAVIDCGYERRAAYDPDLDRNTLFKSLISMHSATQRAGRAGRTAPGTCIRLWSKETEAAMPPAIQPEIERLELSALALIATALFDSPSNKNRSGLMTWLNAPEEKRWAQALDSLTQIGAIKTDGHDGSIPLITDRGRQLLKLPIHPVAGSILINAQKNQCALLSCAMIALWEEADRKNISEELFSCGLDLIENPRDRQFSHDIAKSFEQLTSLIDSRFLNQDDKELKTFKTSDQRLEIQKRVAFCWMPALKKRIAIRNADNASYSFAGSINANLEIPKGSALPMPPALLALGILETTTKGGRRKKIIRYLELQKNWITECFADEIVVRNDLRWDEKTQMVMAENCKLLGDLTVESHSVKASQAAPEECVALLAQKMASKEIDLFDESIQQINLRIKCAAGAFPEYGFPAMNDDDWMLIYHEVAHGCSSRKELEQRSLMEQIKNYIGSYNGSLLDSLVPAKLQLPSGRIGKITYFENSPPELSARIGDFLGMQGKITVCKGRIEGIYNILAPNYRTVQKTRDLTGFWQNTYAEIKAELKRKYPKHPWP